MLVPRDKLKKADAIVTLTGNGLERANFAVELFKNGWAPCVVMVGLTGSRPCWVMAHHAQNLGVPEEKIIIAQISTNTKLNAVEVLTLAGQNRWNRIILVTSPHHQLRAHLTFKKTLEEQKSWLEIINHPPTHYSWFEIVESSRDKNKKIPRIGLMIAEFYRIAKYYIKGDL